MEGEPKRFQSVNALQERVTLQTIVIEIGFVVFLSICEQNAKYKRLLSPQLKDNFFEQLNRLDFTAARTEDDFIDLTTAAVASVADLSGLNQEEVEEFGHLFGDVLRDHLKH